MFCVPVFSTNAIDPQLFIKPYKLSLILLYNILQCGAALDKDDLIVLNGTPDDMSELVQRILRKKDKAKQEKKVRKHQAVSEGQCEDSEQCENEVGESKNKQKRPQIGDGLSNGQKKKIKLASDKTSVSSSKFEETSSYKKLFHKNGVKKDKAHWVTYNPYYN